MPRVVEKPGFQTGSMVEVCQRNDNQLLNSCFCYYCGWNSFKMKLESVSFQDRLVILLEKRLGGVAEQ